MHFLQAINSDISVLIVCNKTGVTIKGDIKKGDISLFFCFVQNRIVSEKLTLTFSSFLLLVLK